ncbi:L-2-hydroxyglutarate dehydrogenase, mitochondrial isoform X1 [Hydra vulgaris]|uniref:L-2-hydroxyglutarate dehydrogenase, mitochondrial isoform X1 n=1 Tax=Hydra vulgaris TaxID=6087 RepID=UPI001F5E6651|nr:L-2-hydroxyglutarate dehydrogenase, mitochondrial [Hydra vulgaris]
MNKSVLQKCFQFKFISRSFYNKKYDVAIVGGGIVGTSLAQEILKRNPNLKCIILEKEENLALHQTGRNSGVIHAGIYYQPGTLKAILCVRGQELLYKYCDEYKIPYKKVGKLIVATSLAEVERLKGLFNRGIQNGVTGLSMISKDNIKQIEPHCEGFMALHSPNTGIVDYGLVTKAFAKSFTSRQGTIAFNFQVENIIHSIEDSMYPVKVIGKNQPSVLCRYVITCGGLYSDRLARMTACSKEPGIVPFRGDYLLLKQNKRHLVNGNIYPVPDPRFPFLGVHFTPRMDGNIWLGPNAILAFSRQGYNLTDFSMKDSFETFTNRGFWKLMKKHWKFASQELYEGFFIKKTVQKLQNFIPELTTDDVERGPSGVRAQALAVDGNLVDDFVFDFGKSELGQRCLHVRNAPSPAATSSLAIAEVIADKFEQIYNE